MGNVWGHLAATPASSGPALLITLAVIGAVGTGLAVILRLFFLERPAQRREEDRKVRQERDECTAKLADCLLSKAQMASEHNIELMTVRHELALAQVTIERLHGGT